MDDIKPNRTVQSHDVGDCSFFVSLVSADFLDVPNDPGEDCKPLALILKSNLNSSCLLPTK